MWQQFVTWSEPRHWNRISLQIGVITGLLVFLASLRLVYRWQRRRWMDQRRDSRRPGNPVKVTLANSADPPVKVCTGIILDRSAGGLGLSAPQKVARGTILNVRPSDGPETTPWAQVEVRNCRQRAKDWQLYCKYVTLPPWDVMKRFG